MANSNLFQSPPVRTPFIDLSGKAVPDIISKTQWFFSWPWIKYFQQVSVQLSQPVSLEVPATSTSPGAAGQVSTDGTYLYVATGTNQWKRAALTVF